MNDIFEKLNISHIGVISWPILACILDEIKRYNTPFKNVSFRPLHRG